MKKVIFFALAFCLTAACLVLPVGAADPYEGYRYDYWDTPLPMHNGYDAVQTISAEDMGLGKRHEGDDYLSVLDAPTDLFYAADGFFYLVDSGNNRILKLDAAFQCVGEWMEFTMPDGMITQLSEPSGVFVDDDGTMYIADTGNLRVLVCDAKGKVSCEITCPDSDIFPEGVDFAAAKVLKDNRGNLYVLVKGLYYGVASFGRNYTFTGFYGANKVSLSAAQLLEVAWRKIFPRSSMQYQSQYVPVELSNMAIDNDGFVYTCTSTMSISEKIRKLNAMSINLLTEANFGDKQTTYSKGGTPTDTQFVDLCIDDEGFINALDYTRGRIFQYDASGELVFVFGGSGNQVGLFRQPMAIESVGDRLYVLDGDKMCITVFAPNQLAKNTHNAIALYNQGLYSEALEPWQEVLRSDTGNTFAYASMGKAYLEVGDYEKAMENFKLGQDREGYSEAYREYRTQQIRYYFPYIGVAAIVLLLAVFVYAKRRVLAPVLAKVGIRVSAEKKTKQLKGWRYLGYIMTHPTKGYEELKYGKGGKFSIACALIFFWFALLVVQYEAQGFIFNENKTGQINIGVILLSTVCVFLAWVLSNWCLCTLFNGEGRMKGIFIYSAYALTPHLICTAVSIVLSRVLTLDEGVFISWIGMLGVAWSVILLLCGMMTLHNYSGAQSILFMILTVVGMVIITFLLVLAITLVQQMLSFGVTIFRELEFRQYS